MKKTFTWIANNINTQAFTNLYDSLLFVIDFIVSRTSDSLAGILIKALPLLAPVPNAVSVWRISQHAPLNYDTLQAGALAASVEGLFFALTAVALDMFDGYLLDKNRYKWPLWIAVSLLIGFFGLVEVIVLFIETNPVAMAFPVISLIAAIGLGCARWHLRNQKTPHFAKLAKASRVKIATEKAENTPILHENVDPIAKMHAAKQEKITQRRMTILQMIDGEGLPLAEIAKRTDCSTRTIRNDLEALQSAGHSMSVNGVVKLAP